MAFVVTATTQGDDLIPSKQVVMAVRNSREEAEMALAAIETERNDWLAKHGSSIPWWAECSVYSEFDVREVP